MNAIKFLRRVYCHVGNPRDLSGEPGAEIRAAAAAVEGIGEEVRDGRVLRPLGLRLSVLHPEGRISRQGLTDFRSALDQRL